ncbi:MAG: ferrous iron transport protein B [Lachnospiraceae bacterium]|nr:ferrous iron transport protein B [Lachnospiraceae bacterium]
MKIALLGQPNSGKSTLYNGLTGAHQHVGNWPGKTVEKKEGSFTANGKTVEIVDLPGTYSLAANSDEEIITRDYIVSGEADLVVILADASQLERSMFMLADYAGIRVPCMLLLNMMDVAESQGKKIDAASMEKKLNIPVIPFIASNKKTYDAFYKALERIDLKKSILNTDALKSLYATEFGETYTKVMSLLPEEGISSYSPEWIFAKLLEQDGVAEVMVRSATGDRFHEIKAAISHVKQGASHTGNCKFSWIDSVMDGAVSGGQQDDALCKFDIFATSKVKGRIFAVIVILLSLVFSILLGFPFMGIGSSIPALAAPLANTLLEAGVAPLLVSILCEGIITAFAFTFMMCGYVFGATFVFGLLEEIGYLSRISYLFDGTMRKMGLHGKAIMPFLISFGCNIGGGAASRVLDTWGQRVLTIALSWVVPCGSTWAVVGLVSTLFFGPMGAVVIILLLFATSVLHLYITSRIYGKKLLTDADRTGLIMELPPYHKPRWGELLKNAFRKMGQAFKRAIALITVISVILCLLSYTSDGNLDGSILYRFGNAIEPVTLFFGLRWQTFIAWLASWMGKEGSLGALASVFSNRSVMSAVAVMTYNPVDSSGVGAGLAEVLSKPEALAFIFAFYFNMPCSMALSAAMHETHSVKWPLRIAAYYIVLSLLLACVVYHVTGLFL